MFPPYQTVYKNLFLPNCVYKLVPSWSNCIYTPVPSLSSISMRHVFKHCMERAKTFKAGNVFCVSSSINDPFFNPWNKKTSLTQLPYHCDCCYGITNNFYKFQESLYSLRLLLVLKYILVKSMCFTHMQAPRKKVNVSFKLRPYIHVGSQKIGQFPVLKPYIHTNSPSACYNVTVCLPFPLEASF